MSATVTSTLDCDRDGCGATFTGDGWPNQARTIARRNGWSSTRQKRLDADARTTVDRCPAHPFGSDTPIPTLF